ncbi:MAG: hypothetical protein M3Z32_02080 [Acidobacteriota bacterium]|nr:hypothetical protein [Acidobacteriota bacterium]
MIRLSVETSLLVAEGLASTTLVIRFLTAGLSQVYRFFFIYLIAFCLQLMGAFFIETETQAYTNFFFSTEAAIVFLYFLITLELYSLVLRDLKGIATVARRFIHGAIAVSILFSLLLLVFGNTSKDNVPSFYRNVARFFSFEQPIISSLIFFVFLITGFLFYYPIPLNRNVIHYTIGYAIYFSSKAVLLFLNSGHGQYWNRIMSCVMLGVSAGCLLFWVFALTREGEIKPRSPGGSWTKDEQDRVLGLLSALNASLLRGRRSIP